MCREVGFDGSRGAVSSGGAHGRLLEERKGGKGESGTRLSSAGRSSGRGESLDLAGRTPLARAHSQSSPGACPDQAAPQ